MVNGNESIFHGITKTKDVRVKSAVDQFVTPVAQKHLRVLFHLRDEVDGELQRLFDAGIIESVRYTRE